MRLLCLLSIAYATVLDDLARESPASLSKSISFLREDYDFMARVLPQGTHAAVFLPTNVSWPLLRQEAHKPQEERIASDTQRKLTLQHFVELPFAGGLATLKMLAEANGGILRTMGGSNLRLGDDGHACSGRVGEDFQFEQAASSCFKFKAVKMNVGSFDVYSADYTQ
ncbi:MAG: uncharacterized protein KVP18_004142 [Porospora cf. gigantea A]|uniref:uncharacterized protein n=1 Tax=Porospora cf. gigantea A TaxID=2853593 RepID=UPI003559F1AE|nr:MAG: hypothetical protein KVP18_004142 [Porospora cf. gigantea A]